MNNYNYKYGYNYNNSGKSPYQPPKKPMKSKRTRSIARSVNAGFAGRLFLIFIIIDIIILFPDLRQMYLSSSPVDFTAEQAQAVLLNWRWLFIFEGVAWLWTLIFGSGGVRRKLRPLDEMASAASALTAAGGFDETKFHDLQSAIDSFNPAREGARVRTGDKELAPLELAVNKLIERMHQSYRQQARFVSDASHELRTPIAVIQGYANMLSRWGKEDEKVLNESIEAIQTESERMKRLVEQLLFLARGDAGRTKINMEKLDLSALMREVFDESVMIDGEHQYALLAEEPVYAQGDADMLKQLARILVENAAKYTPRGGDIKLKTGFMGEYPAMTVQDSGIGMQSGDIPHVFERFYRADEARTREGGGTGLGLAIAKWIADRHGGRFEVISREELGTRISLCLPRAGEDGNRPVNKLH